MDPRGFASPLETSLYIRPKSRNEETFESTVPGNHCQPRQRVWIGILGRLFNWRTGNGDYGIYILWPHGTIARVSGKESVGEAVLLED
ncbi:hypothetical protein PoB_000129500 [Plakobranchus ocellatus]|uniref:Uncharacterized protein n=1 Tax=Plakobranchus ocellatus TaxID=259542 RepID=A0AAV3XVZ9_9GAST|nr:hypothetical protein PoB_000129500 [Plakobranchus ocellatus]